MTSRPGPGIYESLQHRGGGSAYTSGRWAANPQHGQQDSAWEPVEERGTKPRPKGKPIPLDAIQTTVPETVRPPPKGKPQLFFSNGVASAEELPSHVPSPANLPVPPRPGSSVPADAPQQRLIFPGGTGVKTETAVKLPGQDAPAQAVVFPAGKTADLFPWIGNHPEDVLSEALVKGGISNKSQIMNETNTARPSLWPNLKNKSGLSTLSTLFVAVLEKRQSSNRLTVPNTFKPPPRLTLRDSTRETWLRDLANPTVTLRRLSRTIPHGITGKVLLEQCLNKDLPIPRAIWLIKCVGINEMRTHKRNGQAGTITWVRGWTSSVEQFLDSIITAVGQPDWKPRINYAIRLVAQLFKERLLEDDHFFDWTLKGLDSCVSERLFVWLLVVCIPDFWQDLLSSRRRGKRLAESLLEHAEKFYELEEDVQAAPVLTSLENIIIKTLATRPACFLLPTTWHRHASVLRILAERHPQTGLSHAIHDLDTRNKNLIRPCCVTLPLADDPVGQIYRLLDAVDYSANVLIDDLSYNCMEVTSNTCQLVSTVLSWASSLYRQGSHRIYLITRLLRKWNHLGADVYDAIVTCLPQLAFDQSKDTAVVFRIIAELARSKTFSPGRFLQWLIATGSLSHHRDLYSPSAWPLRLITEIPLAGLSEHVQNLRCTLLRGTVYTAEAEEQLIITTEDMICQQLPGLFNTDHSVDTHPPPVLGVLGPTVQLEVGAWLRQEVAASMEFMERIPTKDPSVEVSGTVCNITPSDFYVVRSYLESFGDLAILADIIGIVATSLDSNVLSAAADTLSYHVEAFRAIGAFEPLFEKIAMRFAAIRTVQFPERDLLISLTDLARLAHADPQLLHLLSYDLSRYDQRNSLAACSPASDSMADNLLALDIEDEIERILSSGTSMDQQMMGRVFGKVTTNLEEQLCKGSCQVENFSTWLYRLRTFEESTFDMIMASWLGSLLLNHQAQLLSAALPPLISSGCLTLRRFLKTLQECINSRQSSHPEESLRIAVEGLDRLLPYERNQSPCRQYDMYRYRLEQYKLCRQRDSGLLGFLGDIIMLESVKHNLEPDRQLLDLCSSDRLLSALRHFIIQDVRSVSGLISAHQQGSQETQLSCSTLLSSRLLDPLNKMHLNNMSLEQQAATVVPYADQLSLPFCQLVLHQIFSTSALSTDHVVESVSAAFLSTIKTAIEKEQPCWSNLISGLEPDLLNKIREHAERQVIETTAFLCSTTIPETGEEVADRKASVRRYLSVIDATAQRSSAEVQSSLIISLVDRLKGLTESIGQGQDFGNNSGNDKPTNSDLFYWLNVLLRLTAVHCPELMAKAPNQHQAALLWTLRTILSHSCIASSPATAVFVFDVTTLLSDSISEDVRKHLAKLDTSKSMSDARCAFIFGASSSTDAWLSLMQPVASPSVAWVAAPSPQVLPQATNTAQGQWQGQHQITPVSGPMQRTSSQHTYQQQMQSQAQARAYSHYQQHIPGQKMFPQQLQRMGSNGQGVGNMMHLQQQQQQMQALAQQRQMQPASTQQQQRAAATSSPQQQQQTIGAKSNVAKQDKVEMKQVPFTLNRWEILPESGGNPVGNETAISLSLFGARRA